MAMMGNIELTDEEYEKTIREQKQKEDEELQRILKLCDEIKEIEERINSKNG